MGGRTVKALSITVAILLTNMATAAAEQDCSKDLARISQGLKSRVHLYDFVSRIKHLRHMRRV